MDKIQDQHCKDPSLERLVFRVYGRPEAAPRPRAMMMPMVSKGHPAAARVAVCREHKCHQVRIHPGDTDKDWRKAIARAAAQALKDKGYAEFPVWNHSYLLRVRLQFFMPRPASHYTAGDRAKGLRTDWAREHFSDDRRDVDNLAKSVMDTLTGSPAFPQGWFWKDDKQVVVLEVAKLYEDAMQAPGVQVEVAVEATRKMGPKRVEN